MQLTSHIHALKMLKQDGSTSDDFVQFSSLGTASSGRSKTKIQLANYEKGTAGEPSDLALHFDSLHGHYNLTSARPAHLVTWIRVGPSSPSTTQSDKVRFIALEWFPHTYQKPSRAMYSVHICMITEPRSPRVNLSICHLLWSSTELNKLALRLPLTFICLKKKAGRQ